MIAFGKAVPNSRDDESGGDQQQVLNEALVPPLYLSLSPLLSLIVTGRRAAYLQVLIVSSPSLIATVAQLFVAPMMKPSEICGDRVKEREKAAQAKE